jgi:hypothetical protein
VAKNVTAGAYCSTAGASGETAKGLAVTCAADSSGKDRWTSAAVSATNAKAGAFCATTGARATGSNSTALVCKAGSDGRDRWTKQ